MLVIPEEGDRFCNHINRGGGREQKESGWASCSHRIRGGNTNNNWKDFLTFLGHVVHAVGHRRALLLGVQSGEASVVVHKVVVCKKKTKQYNNNNGGGTAYFV